MFLDVLYYFFVVLNISYENYPDGIYISVLINLRGFFPIIELILHRPRLKRMSGNILVEIIRLLGFSQEFKSSLD